MHRGIPLHMNQEKEVYTCFSIFHLQCLSGFAKLVVLNPQRLYF